MSIKEQIRQIPGVEAVLTLEETMNSILFGKVNPSLDNIVCVIFNEEKAVKQGVVETTDETKEYITKGTAIRCATKEEFDFLWSYMTNSDSQPKENFKDLGDEGALDTIGLLGAIVMKSNIEFFRKEGYTLLSALSYLNFVNKLDDYKSYLLNLAQVKGYKDGKFITNQEYLYPIMIEGELEFIDKGLVDEIGHTIYSAEGVWSKLEISLPYYKLINGRIYVWEEDDSETFMFRFKCLNGDQVVTYTMDLGNEQIEESFSDEMSVNFIREATKEECKDYIQFEIENGYFHELNNF
jgi:hypothetical protein